MPSISPNPLDVARGRVWRVEFTGADLALPWLGESGLSVQRVPLGLTPHHHDGFEVHILERGAAAFATEHGRLLRLRGGQFSLTRPGVVHWGEDNLVRPSRLLWLELDPRRGAGGGFTRDDLRELGAVLAAAGDGVWDCPEDALAAFHDLCAAMRERGGTLADARRRGLVCRIVQALAARLAPGAAGAGDGGGALGERALAWMRAHLGEEVAVADVAAACGLHASRFHESFVAATGETPAAALRRLRLEEAAHRLEQGAVSLEALARDLRFADARHLARWFKRQHGCAPAAWRRRAAAAG